MGNQPKILVFAGSARKDSFNKKIARIAVRGAEQAGAQVTFVDLRDYPLPLFDQDLEAQEGIPENARTLKKLMKQHDGWLIASPEYNSSISPLLKNVIDWASRQESPNEPALDCYNGKVVALIAASPGNLGGLRGLVTLRSILSSINVIVLPQQVTVSEAHKAFDGEGNLSDAKKQAAIESVARTLVQAVTKLH